MIMSRFLKGIAVRLMAAIDEFYRLLTPDLRLLFRAVL